MSKGPHFTDADKVLAREMGARNCTAIEIGAALGRDVNSVRQMMRKQGIPYRRAIPKPGCSVLADNPSLSKPRAPTYRQPLPEPKVAPPRKFIAPSSFIREPTLAQRMAGR